MAAGCLILRGGLVQSAGGVGARENGCHRAGVVGYWMLQTRSTIGVEPQSLPIGVALVMVSQVLDWPVPFGIWMRAMVQFAVR